MASFARTMAGIISTTGDVKSTVVGDIGLSVYSTLDSLPTSALTSGDQAFVSENNRIYVSNGSGWYNVALLNATPTLSISPSGAVTLATDGVTPTVITLVGADSDNADASLIYTVESDGSFANIATLSQDSSVFTITPLAEGSATPGSSTLTFKVSDGISFGSGTTQFSLTFGPDWAASATETILRNPVVIAGGYAYTSPEFGYGVSISTDGNYVAVGARGEFANSSSYGGAVYIYTRSGSTWTQQARLVGSTVSTDYRFGSSVSINSDGTYLLVGAYGKNYNVGTAYVFTRSGSTWTQQAEIPSPTTSADLFALRSAINSTGDLVAICAQGNPGATSSYTQSGAVHVYSRSGSTWTLQQTLRASDENTYWRFGRSVRFNSDSTYIIVGAPMSSTGVGNGAAYIFTRSGSTWTQQAKITASDAQVDDYFGTSVSINSDATYAISGAEYEDGGAGDPLTSAGAAYIFTRSGSTWTQQAKITASDIAGGDLFGGGVSMNDNGNYVVVTAIGEDGGTGDPINNGGAAYVFNRSGSTWTQIRKITTSEAQQNDLLGNNSATDISGDGKYAILGTNAEDGGAGDPLTTAGAAYIYEAG
jgi:hypothetical protein